MSLRSATGTALTAVLVLIALSLVVGQLLGQPLLIGYVETGSMEPTLEVGDGFVAIPTIVAGDISEGDVVTFDAQSLQGGGMTTHRISEETPEGYITRGDGNPFTDQEAGEPPVQDSQIVAVALEFDGEVIVLPSLGDGATAVQGAIALAATAVGLDDIGSYGIASTTTAIGVVLIISSLLYDFVAGGGGRRSTRLTDRTELIDSRWILVALVCVLLLPLMTMMVVPSDTQTIQVLSVPSSADDDPTRILAGETEQLPYTVENTQYVPKVVVVESQSTGLEFSESVIPVSHGETRELSMTISVPDEVGAYTRTRSEHHYLHVLPSPIIVALHSIHPYVAMVTISLFSISPIGVLFVLLVGFRPISIRAVHD